MSGILTDPGMRLRGPAQFLALINVNLSGGVGGSAAPVGLTVPTAPPFRWRGASSRYDAGRGPHGQDPLVTSPATSPGPKKSCHTRTDESIEAAAAVARTK